LWGDFIAYGRLLRPIMRRFFGANCTQTADRFAKATMSDYSRLVAPAER
jgi:hypothetical protein